MTAVRVPPDCWPVCEYGVECPHEWRVIEPAPVEVHSNNYLSGDGFAYCQECTEASDDYVLVTDCPHRAGGA